MLKYPFLFLALLCPLLTFSQDVVSGKVFSAIDNKPLAGAHVLVGYRGEGVVTDANGYFSLILYWDENVLKISYPGFQPLTYEVKAGEKQLTLFLEPLLPDVDTVITFDPETYEEPMQIVRNDRPLRDPSLMGSDWNTEDYSPIYENSEKRASESPVSTFSIDVDRAAYANIRRFTEQGVRPPMDAVRIEEMINYFHYDYPQPKGEHPFSVYTELSDCPWNPERKLLHIGLQGKTVDREELPPNNLVFLIDVSGSMDDPLKLPLLQSAFALLVEQLRPEDRVAIVVYASSTGLVLPPTSGADKDQLLAAIHKLRAGGSTAGGAGIQLAYEVAKKNFLDKGNNRVILATDGDFNVGASSDAELTRLIEEKRQEGIYLTVLGFGMGNLKDNKMELLADKGNGNYAYIDDLKEAKKVFVTDLLGTLYTIAKDVKLQIEFNPYRVRSYRLLGYENRLLNQEDFVDDQKDAGEMGVGHSVTALYEIELLKTPSPTLPETALRYQQSGLTKKAKKSGEMALLSIRYKLPREESSRLFEDPLLLKPAPLALSSETFRFAAAVAGFGLLLRESPANKSMNYEEMIQLARGALGKDPEGWRKEFVEIAAKQKEN